MLASVAALRELSENANIAWKGNRPTSRHIINTRGTAMFKNTRSIVSLAAMGMMALALAGCEKEGPAEKAGKEIDNAVSQAGQEMEKVGDNIQNAANTAQK